MTKGAPRQASPGRRPRWPYIAVGVVVVLALIVLGAYQLAARTLKADVLAALGPQSEIGDVHLGFGAVKIEGLRVKAPAGWPADSSLKAATVTIVPDLRELLTGEIYITSVTVEDGYIAAVRPAKGGGLRILPGVLDRKPQGGAVRTKHASAAPIAAANAAEPSAAPRDGAATPAKSSRTANIDRIILENCVVELYDRSITGRARLHVDAVHGTIRHVIAPQLTGHTTLALQGAIAHGNHRGTLRVDGWVDVARKSSELKAVVRNVDLVPFAPYVADKAKAGIDAGTFNLDLTAKVRDNVVDAHGVLVIDQLALHTGEGPLAAFDALPQRAFLRALHNDKGQVEIAFDLKGNLDDPTFSLTGGVGLRAALAVLETIGLGFEGLIQVFLALFSGFAAALTPF